MFLLDHSRYEAVSKSTLIGPKGWVGKVRYLLRRLRTHVVDLPEHFTQYSWMMPSTERLHNSAHTESLTTAMHDVIKSQSHGLYRTSWTLAACH